MPLLTFGHLLHQYFLDADWRITGGGDSGTVSEDDYFVKLGNGTKESGYDYEGDDDNMNIYSYK